MKTPHFFHQSEKEKQNQQIITSLVVLRVGGAEGRGPQSQTDLSVVRKGPNSNGL